MPIPSCHLARKEVVYIADDNTRYRAKFEAALLGLGSAMAAPGTGDANLPTLPKNIKPRGFYIETTNGEDAANKRRKYRRFVPCDTHDLNAGQIGVQGHTIAAFEGCAWVVKGYRGEKTYAR